MTNDLLLQLSPGAAMQLGFGDGEKTAVRVRRVNPPEVERAMLRAGKQAPERMETPQPLLKVLSRKLAENAPLSAKLAHKSDPAADTGDMAEDQSKEPSAMAAADPLPVLTDLPAKPAASAKPAEPKQPAVKPEPAIPDSLGLVVQVAAFSTQDRADGVAGKLGAKVSKPGKYWLVRLGPYGSQGDASKGLAKAKAAGYSDARMQSVN